MHETVSRIRTQHGPSQGRAAASQPVFIDLFAGCGGLSLGLMRAGWKGLFAVEKDSFAFDTLKTNLIEGTCGPRFSWPAWAPKEPVEIGGFIRQYSDEIKRLRGSVDLIAGGPPCQGFSMAGRRKKDDRRNRAIEQYFELVKLVRPTLLLIENVRGITVEFDRGRRARENRNGVGRPAKAFSTRIQEELEGYGYKIFSAVIKGMDFGVPQFRPRFIMIGVQEGEIEVARLNDPFALIERRREKFLTAKGLPIHEPVTVWDAISDLETRGKDLIDSDDSPKFKQAAYSGPITTYQCLMQDGFTGTPNSMRLARHSPEIKARFEKILETCRRGVQLSQKDRLEFGLNKHCTVPLDPGKPCHTLTTLPDDLLHYSEPRILTVREYARLQSFPDWYSFKGKYTTGGHLRVLECPRYTQIGNAVPPLVAESIGSVLKDIRSCVVTKKNTGKTALRPRSESREFSVLSH